MVVAFHPYSQPMTRVDYWNDGSNTTNSYDTRTISMQNISVLTSYMAYMENIYEKPSGSIRVILSEQGWSAGGGEWNQAFAIALGYYIAEFNDRIDAYIIRAEIDDWSEVYWNNLYLGLKDLNENKRMAYYVYKYMDTPRVSNPDGSSIDYALKDYNASSIGFSSDANRQRFINTQSLLQNWNWAAWVAGYDESKLNKMPYAYSELNP